MYTNNIQALEAVYDTKNIVLCDVCSGPAGLGLSLALVSMGKAFRAIDVTLSVLGAYGAITIYNLLLPPGSEPPTAANIKTYDNTNALRLGGAARAKYIAREGSGRVSYTIERSLSPDAYPDETGPIDGFSYDCYFYAEDAAGKKSYIVKYKKPVMSMPFHTGRGTALSPFGIREINKDELSRYPDLLPGHPLNSAGVAQTARMLENIGRLSALYESSKGLHGLRRSLTLNYTLHTPMDLDTYKNAYNGRGWQPIGLGARSKRCAFSGKLNGGGHNTPIRNMQISQLEDGAPNSAGLFYAIEHASLSDIAIQDASLFVIAGGSSKHKELYAGALAGRVKGGELSRIRLERILILAASCGGGGALRLGGLSGHAQNAVRIKECRAKNLIIADLNARDSRAGGLFGGLTNKRQTALLEDIVISKALILGKNALGGAIGQVIGGAAVKRATLSELTIHTLGKGAGGFAGIWSAQNIIHTYGLELIKVNKLSITARDTAALASGGLIGLLNIHSPLKIRDCTVTHSHIDCEFACGGFIGLAEAVHENLLYVEDCSAQANISGAYMVGGFSGALYMAGLFKRCHSSGGSVSGVLMLGGFTGYSASTRFKGCESTQHVRPYSKFAIIEGGFVGLSASNDYADCHASGDVDTLLGFCGGFVGIQSGSTDSHYPKQPETYIRCHAGGDVCGPSRAAFSTMSGGFMGLGILFLMRECYASGDVMSGAGGMGGLVAGIRLDKQTLLKPIIEDCYSVSSLKCTANLGAMAGGIVGRADYGIIRRCYYSGVINAGAPIGGIAASIGGSAVEITNCLLIAGGVYASAPAASRFIGHNAGDAFISANYASTGFLHDNGTLSHVTDDPDGPDGQSIDPNEIAWFITNVLNWDVEHIWKLKALGTHPLLRGNMECT